MILWEQSGPQGGADKKGKKENDMGDKHDMLITESYTRGCLAYAL